MRFVIALLTLGAIFFEGFAMALMTSYLIKTGNLGEFLNAIRGARAPERFTNTFLKDLDFTSSNDRLYIGVLKGLGFLDENGAPTERYFAFLDQSQSGVVLAEAIREAYDDLFALNRDAQNMEADEVAGKLRTLTRGQKSENVISLMANTFRVLSDQADWTSTPKPPPQEPPIPKGEQKPPLQEQPVKPSIVEPPGGGAPEKPNLVGVSSPLQLHYNIQIVLPDSRDQAVYDALFASLRKHLL